MAIRIVLIKENIYKSHLLASALENNGIRVVDTSNKFTEIDILMKQSKPDALVFSLDTAANQAVNAAEKARKINPGVGLVFLTNVPDLRLLGINEKELPRGVQVVDKNSVTQLDEISHYLERSIQALEATSSAVKTDSSTDGSVVASYLQSLTQVQIDTLRLVALGCSNAEIARIRLVTEKAVEHTITRMLLALKIAANPRHNARVLLSREFFRWVEVDNQTPKLVS